jgi:hypothetical protein
MLLPTFAVLIATSITSPETARGRGSIDARKRTCANFTASDLRKMLGAALRDTRLTLLLLALGLRRGGRLFDVFVKDPLPGDRDLADYLDFNLNLLLRVVASLPGERDR